MRKLFTLGALLFTVLSFSQTKEIDSLTIQLAFQNQDTLKAKTSLLLIKSLYDMGDYSQALRYTIESEKLSTSLNYIEGLAEANYYKALIYAKKNDYINAVSTYTKSRTFYETIGDDIGIAKVNSGMGFIEISRGNYAKGLDYALSAIKILESNGLKNELSRTYSSLAEAYFNINEFDLAIEFYEKALGLQKTLGDKAGVTKSNSRLAELYSMKKEHRKAIAYYEDVLQDNADSDSIKGHISAKLGGEYLQFNDYDKASKYLLESLNLNRRLNNDLGLIYSLNNLGKLNLKQGNLLLAENQLTEAGTLAKSNDMKHELLEYYDLMKDLDSTRGRFESAFQWQRNYYDLKTKIDRNNQTPNAVEDHLTIPTKSNVTSETEDLQWTPRSNAGSLAKDPSTIKILFYIVLAILIMSIVFIVVTYSKRMNSIKYVQELEETNLKTQLQYESCIEQTKHLENINTVKDKLFSIISHDLKDSLSSINGFINILQDGSLSREEFDNLIPELSENANNASLLLFNLLNWSKSQMQSLDPKPSLFDIQEIFEEKIKLIDQRINQKGIQLINHSLRDFAYADKNMIGIVFQNLLANALKFCHPGDTITISNHISNGSAIISIADTGVGIAKENIGKLFKSSSFTTVGTNNEKGTGLGLSICKELVELNHGKIWVESTLNVGSTFYVQLPKSKPE